MERKDHLSPEDQAAFEEHARKVIDELEETSAGKAMKTRPAPTPETLKERYGVKPKETKEMSDWQNVGIVEGMSEETWSVPSKRFIDHLVEQYGAENVQFRERSDGEAWVFVREERESPKGSANPETPEKPEKPDTPFLM